MHDVFSFPQSKSISQVTVIAGRTAFVCLGRMPSRFAIFWASDIKKPQLMRVDIVASISRPFAIFFSPLGSMPDLGVAKWLSEPFFFVFVTFVFRSLLNRNPWSLPVAQHPTAMFFASLGRLAVHVQMCGVKPNP